MELVRTSAPPENLEDTDDDMMSSAEQSVNYSGQDNKRKIQQMVALYPGW